MLLGGGGEGEGGIRLWRWSLGCHESFLMSHRPKCYHRYFIRNFTEIPSKSLFISSRMSLQTFMPSAVSCTRSRGRVGPLLLNQWNMLLPKQYSLMLGGGHLIYVVVSGGLKVIERRAV